ncbi:toxin YoeB [Clostridia bacterium]|nr:toxin YoeB [Clostridia bacterium]
MGDYFTFNIVSWKQYKELEKNDKKKVEKLMDIIIRDETLGHTEPLKHNLSGYFSVRINEKDRLVYRVVGDHVEIISCKGHYED